MNVRGAGVSLPLAWNLSPSPGIAEYAVCYGPTSMHYTIRLSVGLQTNLTITELAFRQTYYFDVCAVNKEGENSIYANQISYTTSEPPTIIA